MPQNHPFDLVIGLDRSDRKADVYAIDTRSDQVHKQTLDAAPEALHDWLAQLRQQHPESRVAVCLEQPATNLILFLEAYAWITLYAINPITLQNSAKPSSPAVPKTTPRTRSTWRNCCWPITPSSKPGSPTTARHANSSNWSATAAPSSTSAPA